MSDLLINDLKYLIARKQIILVVGAGVSIATTNRETVASWHGLIENGIDRCDRIIPDLPANWASRRKAEVESGDMDELLSAAEHVSARLQAPKGGEFRRWLRETVGSLSVRDAGVIQALHALGVPIVTTNYDGLLEEITGLPPITWRDSAEVERVLRGDEKAILHLHGYWRDPESIVLGRRSYDDVKRDTHAQTILQALRTVSSLLFVGCGEGLTDPNIGNLLQ